ncbi:MAG: 2Fe-2S iron-sulfur cluster binding domain-containing protein [Spirochaetaceae bacterium]|jgi:carbon-monoxide dehydrogenase small subunit|nr:2Fe-2S iron-sulfur cluster binding domain-containing protein [Spirochaetaceae bacterium]
MTVEFILNNKRIVLDAYAETRLIDILRSSYKLTGAKAGCLSGVCGACIVLYNGEAVKSCLIPAFRIGGSTILTLEGFAETDEYCDIVAGLTATGMEGCLYCRAGKILTIASLLAKNARPNRQEILAAFDGIRCRCTDPDSLVDTVMAVAAIRQRRLYGRS